MIVAPMAKPVAGAHWPLYDDLCTSPPPVPIAGACAFGARRDGGRRRTVGITLRGSYAQIVLAPLDAKVIACNPWSHGTWIVYIETTDYFIGLGEVESSSWKRDFGIDVGDERSCNRPVAILGRHEGGHRSCALHFSMYTRPKGFTGSDFLAYVRSGSAIWWTTDTGDEAPPPSMLLDPTDFLKAAALNYR